MVAGRTGPCTASCTALLVMGGHVPACDQQKGESRCKTGQACCTRSSLASAGRAQPYLHTQRQIGSKVCKHVHGTSKGDKGGVYKTPGGATRIQTADYAAEQCNKTCVDQQPMLA